ncbi:MAG TPA: cold shock and DUF1294 domain-containing protein [Pyrinomonadaceae bacterium]|nr:cold shock and DUF1294 domain-containing protein [Pyrinomonadaceae bacterium]
MRVQGKITDWNDLRGFGFVSPLERAERVFVHISAFPSGSRRPTDGEFVSYTLGTDERGRRCATLVTYVVSRPKRFEAQTRSRDPYLFAGCVAAAFLGVVVLLAVVGRLWWPVAFVYIVISIATFFTYKHDKWAAQVGARRTNEWTLVMLGLIGGWPGALVARHWFRHKTRKVAFRVGYWLSVVLNVTGVAWLIAQ